MSVIRLEFALNASGEIVATTENIPGDPSLKIEIKPARTQYKD